MDASGFFYREQKEKRDYRNRLAQKLLSKTLCKHKNTKKTQLVPGILSVFVTWWQNTPKPFYKDCFTLKSVQADSLKPSLASDSYRMTTVL